MTRVERLVSEGQLFGGEYKGVKQILTQTGANEVNATRILKMAGYRKTLTERVINSHYKNAEPEEIAEVKKLLDVTPW